jgi:Flp pilus assembly pilin Flp
MFKKIGHFFASQEGTTSIEYALICSLIFLAIILSVSSLGSAVNRFFQSVASAFP